MGTPSPPAAASQPQEASSNTETQPQEASSGAGTHPRPVAATPVEGTSAPAGLPLRRGHRGEAVRDLQQRLALVGYSRDDDPLHFDAATEAALRRFQADRGLVVDGICGPQTWGALVEADHRLGDRLLYYKAPMMRGDDVADLQRRLGQLGFDPHWVDGILGPRTQRAVRQFQHNVGLPDDGVVGHSTVEALDRLASRTSEEITIAQVREHERLRSQSSSVEGKRIVVGDSGELPVITQAMARRLRHAGAQVLSFNSPDLSHQARTSNQWGADIYLGITLVLENYGVAYFAMSGFESVGGRALACRCSSALGSVIDEPVPAVPMRLPILRATRMPAVWCRIGPGPVVVPRAPQIAYALSEAVTDWCLDPGIL